MTWGKGRLNLEQLAAQNASQAEDARTEQHDAAGLRRRGWCRSPVVPVVAADER